MEDVILQYLDEILSQKEDICKCEQCRLDMACYALNKVKPMYVVSSRGVVHTENRKRLDYQNDIDTFSIVAEGVDIVSKTKRHGGAFSEKSSVEKTDNDIEQIQGDFFFNFPQIIGRILDSDAVDVIDTASITLNYGTNDDVAVMFNDRWANPLSLVSQMQGVFSFWIVPKISKKNGYKETFQFNIKIEKEGYETIRKFFEIEVVSSNFVNKYVNDNSYYLEDIYLFPEGLGEDDNNF